VNDDPPREDLDAVAAALELRFPDLRPVRPLHVLGRGFRSLAVETAGGRVLRVGRSPDAAVDYEKEWRTAPFLVEHLPELLVIDPFAGQTSFAPSWERASSAACSCK
jgi:hypothetical protein